VVVVVVVVVEVVEVVDVIVVDVVVVFVIVFVLGFLFAQKALQLMFMQADWSHSVYPHSG
jgi:hypothetical protein